VSWCSPSRSRSSLALLLVVFLVVPALSPARQTEQADAAGEAPASEAATAQSYVTVERGTNGIKVTADGDFATTEAFNQLDDAVEAFEAKGYDLGFEMVDLKTGKGVSLNEDTSFYPASSIKAPFVISLYKELFDEEGVSTSVATTCENCVVNSDNQAFVSLVDTYGKSYLEKWLDESGIAYDQESLSSDYYPYLTPDQLATMWKAASPYLAGSTKGGATCAKLLSSTGISSIREVVGSKYKVMSKAGWYPDTGSYAATVDAGIVAADTGSYVVAIMSNAPEDFASLEKIVDALNIAHAEMTGGDTSSSITSATKVPNGDNAPDVTVE
jgi:beta-lactamase class A